MAEKKYPRRKTMRALHRKTRVKNEEWALIGNWYWCPQSCLEERIRLESPDPIPEPDYPTASMFIGRLSKKHWAYLKYVDWCKTQRAVYSRLAHLCQDGKIRSIYIEDYSRKKYVSQYRIQCGYCREKLSAGMRAIMTLELDF